jgi:cytidine deaminase
VEIKDLIKAATAARENAFALYSNFRVGAAIETADGKIYAGCNIESASYGLTVCAERVAVWKAVSEGARDFRQIAIVTDTENLTPPCGACRQILWEFCGDVFVTLANLQGKSETLHLRDLLPRAFGRSFLEE